MYSVRCPSLPLQAFCFSFIVPPECLSLLPPDLTVGCSSYRPQFSNTIAFKQVLFSLEAHLACCGGALQAHRWLQVSRMVADSLFVHLNFIPRSDCFRENMPSHFKFKEYCPMVFRNLRERFGIDDQDFQVSCFHNIYLKWVSLMPFAP